MVEQVARRGKNKGGGGGWWESGWQISARIGKAGGIWAAAGRCRVGVLVFGDEGLLW